MTCSTTQRVIRPQVTSGGAFKVIEGIYIVRVFVLGGYIWRRWTIIIMSRLNRKLTQNIEERIPVAVTRTKRFSKKKSEVSKTSYRLPSGMFYRQAEGPKICKDKFIFSAADKGTNKQELEDGKQGCIKVDNSLRMASKHLSDGLNGLQIAVSQINLINDTDGTSFQGFVEEMGANGNISYKLWISLILGKDQIMETVALVGNELKKVNEFLVNQDEEEWEEQLGQYIENQENGVEDEKVMEKLRHLKKQQGNSMMLAEKVTAMNNRIQEAQEAEKMDTEAEKLREQDISALVAKQQTEMNTLLARHRADADENTHKTNATLSEVQNASLRAAAEAAKTVKQAKLEVAIDISEYSKDIVNGEN
jgi:hypothetical protein